jgi:hypothetical protein
MSGLPGSAGSPGRAAGEPGTVPAGGRQGQEREYLDLSVSEAEIDEGSETTSLQHAPAAASLSAAPSRQPDRAEDTPGGLGADAGRGGEFLDLSVSEIAEGSLTEEVVRLRGALAVKEEEVLRVCPRGAPPTHPRAGSMSPRSDRADPRVAKRRSPSGGRMTRR